MSDDRVDPTNNPCDAKPARRDYEPLVPLLAAHKSGSKEALNEACRHYQPLVRYVIERHFANRPRLMFTAGTSSIVQVCNYEVARDIGDFKGDTVEELFDWVMQVCLRNCLDADRGRQRMRKIGLATAISLDRKVDEEMYSRALLWEGDGHFDEDDRRQEIERVLAAAEALRERARTVIKLRFSQGLSFWDIGDKIGRSPQAAQKICERALRKLRRKLLKEPRRPRPGESCK